MKKFIFVSALFALIAVKGHSQTQEGNLLLGGNASINLNTADNSSFYINPNTGYFIADNICVGLSLPIAYMNDNFYLGMSPFGRYYFNVEETKSLFLSGSIGITNLLDTDRSLDPYALSVGVGHVWFLNENIGLEAQLVGSTDFDDLNIGLLAGFQIYFNKNK